ncbi:flexible cuticle protein 12-like [Diprion similis]|uniref:flexible cuticle protein 12-like n=1 Tax=Diprion similis TaxID=362088 RepID=UPI001EF856DE|nr:flexible cuticle protein 12-like [Diprion similis]
MKIAILVFAAILGTVVSAPQGSPNEVTIVQQEEQNNIGVSGYKYSYELSDGQKKEETAELVNEGTDEESLVVKGSFAFVGLDGQTYVVTYVADKDGFRPVAQHLPK